MWVLPISSVHESTTLGAARPFLGAERSAAQVTAAPTASDVAATPSVVRLGSHDGALGPEGALEQLIVEKKILGRQLASEFASRAVARSCTESKSDQSPPLPTALPSGEISYSGGWHCA